MTKGWSFGALTEALKSGAFTNSSEKPNIGEMPVVDSLSNIVLPFKSGSGSSGLSVMGPTDKHKSGIYHSSGTLPNNALSSFAKFELPTGSVSFGILRSDTGNSLGYGLMDGDSLVSQYVKSTGVHKFAGSLYSTALTLGSKDTSATGSGSAQVTLKPIDDLNFTLSHKTRTWKFGQGTIDAGEIEYLSGDMGVLKCKLLGAAWDKESTAGLQVVLVRDGASTIFRATRPDKTHVTQMKAALVTGDQSVARWMVGGNTDFLQLKNYGPDDALVLTNGGIKTENGPIVASKYVGAGGADGARINSDGNVYGSVWNNWYLKTYIDNKVSENINNTNNRLQDIRWANQRRATPGGWSEPLTGINGDGTNARTSDLQFYKVSTGWITAGFV